MEDSKLCQEWDLNPRLHVETRSPFDQEGVNPWVWRLRPLGHPDNCEARSAVWTLQKLSRTTIFWWCLSHGLKTLKFSIFLWIWTHASIWQPEVPLSGKESTLESGALDRSAILKIRKEQLIHPAGQPTKSIHGCQIQEQPTNQKYDCEFCEHICFQHSLKSWYDEEFKFCISKGGAESHFSQLSEVGFGQEVPLTRKESTLESGTLDRSAILTNEHLRSL